MLVVGLDPSGPCLHGRRSGRGSRRVLEPQTGVLEPGGIRRLASGALDVAVLPDRRFGGVIQPLGPGHRGYDVTVNRVVAPQLAIGDPVRARGSFVNGLGFLLDTPERLTASLRASSGTTIVCDLSRDSRPPTAEAKRQDIARPIASLAQATVSCERALLPRERRLRSMAQLPGPLSAGAIPFAQELARRSRYVPPSGRRSGGRAGAIVTVTCALRRPTTARSRVEGSVV